MKDELVKQRIRYIVEHGNVLPRTGRDWLPTLVTIAAIAFAVLVIVVTRSYY